MHNLPSRFKDRQRYFAKQKPRQILTKKGRAAMERQKAKSKERRKEKRKEKAKDRVKEYAKRLKREMTPAELALWARLSQWPKPFKCRTQHPIGMRIADFVFCAQHVIVEVDGGYHLNPDQRLADKARTWYLKRCGFSVVRFTNEQVFEQLDDVVQAISERIGRTKAEDVYEKLPPPINEFDEMLFDAVRKPSPTPPQIVS